MVCSRQTHSTVIIRHSLCPTHAPPCLLFGVQLTKSQDYQTLKHAHNVYIHPSSVLAKDQREGVLHSHLIYHELAFTTKEYMRDCTPIQVQAHQLWKL